jgi:hypothetical protein
MNTKPSAVLHARRFAVAAVTAVAAIGLAGLTLSTMVNAATPAQIAGVGATASPSTLPNSDIKGTTAHWVPKALTATADWKSGTTCTAAAASFTMINDTKKSQAVTLTATGITGSDKFTLKPKVGEYICITTGYTGTAHAALADKKKLTVKF